MPTFKYVQPDNRQLEIINDFREKYQKLYDALDLLDKSRGLSLAITKLEESAFWLNKSITKND